MTLYQGRKVSELAADGWATVSGPVSLKTPIGGPILMMNEIQQLIRVMSDGTVQHATVWKDGLIA